MLDCRRNNKPRLKGVFILSDELNVNGSRLIFGFYFYGEISPYTTGHGDLPSQTMTLPTISEN